MARLLIEYSRFGMSEEDEGLIVAEARVRDGEAVYYMSLSELEGFPNFYKTEESAYDRLISGEYDAELYPDLLDLGDYDEILEKTEDPLFSLYRYLIYLVRAEWEDSEAFQEATQGKYLEDIQIPPTDLEQAENSDAPAEPQTFDEKEMLYRMRLAMEADIATPSVFHDMNPGEFQSEKEQFKAIMSACTDRAEYNTWKMDYINAQLAKLNKLTFLVCTYAFDGFGQYEMVLPQVGLKAFQEWLDENESASFVRCREATIDDLMQYISLHAAEQSKQH